MVPDIDLQLRVVIKALRDVVLPAVDSGNRLALEQLHLSIATLGMVEARLPLAGSRLRAELANAIALAEAADAAALAAPLSAAKAVLEDPRADGRDLEIHKARLLTAVSTLVDGAPGDGARADSLARAVVAASKPQFDLIRAWCLPAGFEPDPNEVPPIERLLAKPESSI
jgi:hypothetical protein